MVNSLDFLAFFLELDFIKGFSFFGFLGIFRARGAG